jgi:hypothetical protein
MTTPLKPFTEEQLTSLNDEHLAKIFLESLSSYENKERLFGLLDMLHHYRRFASRLTSEKRRVANNNEADKIFDEVQEQVNTFLYTKGCRMPVRPIPVNRAYLRAKYGTNTGAYDCLLGKIFYADDSTIDELPEILGHEFTHYIQALSGMFSQTTTLFQEGCARGVERQIAELNAKRFDPQEYNTSFLRRHIDEIENTLDIHRRYQEWFSPSLPHTWPFMKHDLGNALFYLAEAKHGKRIYADVLRGDFSSILG